MAKSAKKTGKSENLANEEHDDRASLEAERRMALREDAGKDDRESESKSGGTAEMDREHDPGALEEASERMLLRRDR
jgi:hypothetical protein